MDEGEIFGWKQKERRPCLKLVLMTQQLGELFWAVASHAPPSKCDADFDMWRFFVNVILTWKRDEHWKMLCLFENVMPIVDVIYISKFDASL
jgi:hypothetical protein